jgi:hypothetical protein
MKQECFYSRTVSIAFLVLVALHFPVSSVAQTEVQIMVNGSWDYVEDPNPNNDPTAAGRSLNRIVLVAPQTASHNAFAFSGNDATKFKDASGAVIGNYQIPKPGVYYLDINNLTQSYSHKPLPADLKPQVCSNIKPTWQSIPTNKIRDIIYNHPNATGMSRFAISLPTPDYYTTYGGQFGFSESKVDVNPISSQTPANYTTWMVLHYWVTSLPNAAPSATFTGIPDDGSIFSLVSYTFTSSSGTPGISVVMAAVNGMNDYSCDSFSQESFDHATALWGLTRYASFPAEQASGSGVQIAGSYPGCTKCPPGKVCIVSGGSADCHACQMSINGIIENSAP